MKHVATTRINKSHPNVQLRVAAERNSERGNENILRFALIKVTAAKRKLSEKN